MDELSLLHQILTKLDEMSESIEGIQKRVSSLEAGIEFIRKSFETNGKSISLIHDRLAVHEREISDLGFEVRGTPVPGLAEPRLVKGKEQ